MVRYLWRKMPDGIRKFTALILIRFIIPFNRNPSDNKFEGMSQPNPNPTLIVLGNFCGGGGISRSVERYCERSSVQHNSPLLGDTTEATLQPIRKDRAPHVKTLQEIKRYDAPAIVVIHLNPPHFLLILARLGKKFLKNKRIIAYWAWEICELPAVWRLCLNAVDEVEVPSSFTQGIIAQYTNKPVRVIPPVGRLEMQSFAGKRFGESGTLRCLFIFDLASSMALTGPGFLYQAKS